MAEPKASASSSAAAGSSDPVAVVDEVAASAKSEEAALKAAFDRVAVEYEAVEDFFGTVGTQLVHFVKGQKIPGEIGADLFDKGASIIPVK